MVFREVRKPTFENLPVFFIKTIYTTQSQMWLCGCMRLAEREEKIIDDMDQSLDNAQKALRELVEMVRLKAERDLQKGKVSDEATEKPSNPLQ